MTEGTSQGLFIVVAIVIFGIFVSLSYTLFGKTLQPQVVDLFKQSTEQARNDLHKGKITPVKKLHVINQSQSMEVFKKTENSIVFSTNGKGKWGDGVYITSEILEAQKNYILSYDITRIEGNLIKIGGHITVSNHLETRFNGINIPYDPDVTYSHGIPYKFKDKETVHVEVEFKTDKIIENEDGENEFINTVTPSDDNMNIYIQPNRGVIETEPLTVEISNIEFISI